MEHIQSLHHQSLEPMDDLPLQQHEVQSWKSFERGVGIWVSRAPPWVFGELGVASYIRNGKSDNRKWGLIHEMLG